MLQQITAAAAAVSQLVPSMIFYKGKEVGKEMGEISEKISGLRDENNKLKEKLKTFKKDNTAMNQKIDDLRNYNQTQGETILALESSQEKLQKELESVKEEKEQLRIEIEEKISKFSTENNTLTQKWEELTKEFEAVENENKELKQTVDSIKEENQQLKNEMGNLKAEHKKICEKLECKEARLVLGQIAWLLEAEIWKVVLPDERMGKTGILKSMERWLKKNSSKPEGKAAQKRWDDLKGKLNWNEDDHKWALSHLKKLRIVDAHPEPVDLEEARKQLNEGDYVADTDKDVCEEIIDMIATARKLNNTN